MNGDLGTRSRDLSAQSPRLYHCASPLHTSAVKVRIRLATNVNCLKNCSIVPAMACFNALWFDSPLGRGGFTWYFLDER